MTKKNLTQQQKDDRKVVGLFVGGLGLLLAIGYALRFGMLVLAGFIVYWNVTDLAANGLTTAWPIVWLFVALMLVVSALSTTKSS